jgi:hypothetical protein
LGYVVLQMLQNFWKISSLVVQCWYRCKHMVSTEFSSRSDTGDKKSHIVWNFFTIKIIFGERDWGGGGGVNRQMPTNVLCQECQTRQLVSWIWILVSWHTFFDLRCSSFLNKLHLRRTGSSQFLVVLCHLASLWQFDDRWTK